MLNIFLIWPSDPIPWHIPRESHNSKRYMHPSVHCSTIYSSQDLEARACSLTEEWETKLGYIYTVEYHKKERTWGFYRDVDGPRVCHTEWSKSERERQILSINAYMWKLEKWYWWTFLPGKYRDTDIQNRHLDTDLENKLMVAGRKDGGKGY